MSKEQDEATAFLLLNGGWLEACLRDELSSAFPGLRAADYDEVIDLAVDDLYRNWLRGRNLLTFREEPRRFVAFAKNHATKRAKQAMGRALEQGRLSYGVRYGFNLTNTAAVVRFDRSSVRQGAVANPVEEAVLGPTSELWERVEAIFEGMSADTRDAFWLGRYERLPWEEVAERLHTSADAARKRGERAASQLRRRLPPGFGRHKQRPHQEFSERMSA
jgi:DNA-directed RNA polymerase specialized sigma24 family protein